MAPCELLGIFVGLRARHMRDIGRIEESEQDYLLARHLFPSNRKLYIAAMAVAIERSGRLFEPGEVGSPQSLANWINTQYRVPVPPAHPAGQVPVQDRDQQSFGVNSFRGAIAMVSMPITGRRAGGA